MTARHLAECCSPVAGCFCCPRFGVTAEVRPGCGGRLLIAGTIAYSAAIAVHYAVGYLSLKHLLPAFGGFGLLLLGLFLSYPFLCRKSSEPV